MWLLNLQPISIIFGYPTDMDKSLYAEETSHFRNSAQRPLSRADMNVASMSLSFHDTGKHHANC